MKPDETEAVKRELDDAWAGLAGVIRGMVPLAEVVAGFKDERDRFRKRIAALEAARDVAIRALEPAEKESADAP